jgi:hypothetical protein
MSREPPFNETRTNRRKTATLRIYRCISSRECPLAGVCGGKKARIIEMEPDYEAVELNRQRLLDPANAPILKIRQRTVELLFAIVKEVTSFRR